MAQKKSSLERPTMWPLGPNPVAPREAKRGTSVDLILRSLATEVIATPPPPPAPVPDPPPRSEVAGVRREVLADGVICYLGDSRAILPTIGHLDAIVTDPPYGIGADEAAAKNKGKFGWKFYGDTAWDQMRPPGWVISLLLEISDYQIIWGGNYFTDLLPPTMQWLIWDKGQRDFSLADFEVAWSSQKAAARIIDYSRAAALKDGKEHPTQKPLEVMRWCIQALPAACVSICDPFMGSGTTGVAAVGLGKKFTGIEVNPTYFDIACRRIDEAIRTPDMFIEKPKLVVEQSKLL